MSQWEGGPEQHLHHSSGLLLYSRSPLCLPLREHTEERRRVDSHSLRSHYDASGGWALLWIWRPFVCVAAEAGIHLSHCLTGGDAEGAAKLRADLVVGRSSLAQVCLAENVGTKKKKKKKKGGAVVLVVGYVPPYLLLLVLLLPTAPCWLMGQLSLSVAWKQTHIFSLLPLQK